MLRARQRRQPLRPPKRRQGPFWPLLSLWVQNLSRRPLTSSGRKAKPILTNSLPWRLPTTRSYVDDGDEESLSEYSDDEKEQPQGDPYGFDVPSPTPDLDLDYEKTLDVVESYSPLPVYKHTLVDWADGQPLSVDATVTKFDTNFQTHSINLLPSMSTKDNGVEKS